MKKREDLRLARKSPRGAERMQNYVTMIVFTEDGDGGARIVERWSRHDETWADFADVNLTPAEADAFVKWWKGE